MKRKEIDKKEVEPKVPKQYPIVVERKKKSSSGWRYVDYQNEKDNL